MIIIELIVLTESAIETTWLCWLLKSLSAKQKLSIIMYYNNQALIAFIKNLKYHQQTKRIDMKYFAILEECKNWFMDF